MLATRVAELEKIADAGACGVQAGSCALATTASRLAVFV